MLLLSNVCRVRPVLSSAGVQHLSILQVQIISRQPSMAKLSPAVQISREAWTVLLQLLISISREGRMLARPICNAPWLPAMKAVMLQ